MEWQDSLDLQVLQENRVHQEPLETKDHLALLECRVLMDLGEILDLMDPLDLMAHQEKKVS